MVWNELGDTLHALVRSLEPPQQTGLVVTGAELQVPLEISTGIRQGRLVILAQPPHTRWKSGFTPATHLSRLTIVETGDGG